MSTRSYVVKRIGLGSLARWGFLAGALVACLPGFACSTVFFWLTSSVYRVIEGWRDVGLTFVGQRLSLDLVQLLQLGALDDALKAVQTLGVFGILTLALLIAVMLGITVALSLVLLGVFYNLTGRLKVELAEE